MENETTEVNVAEQENKEAETTLLDEGRLMFLVELEKRANQFVAIDMKKAQAELMAAQRKVTAIEGALEGIQVMFVRTLDEHGVTQETYVRQREDYLKSQSIAEGSQVLA